MDMEEVHLNGHMEIRCSHNLNLNFVEGESLIMAIAVSSGSACTSASLSFPTYCAHGGVAMNGAQFDGRFS